MTQEYIMSKTPYELRYELLMLAQNILTEQIMNERIRLENDWSLAREKASIQLSNGDTKIDLPPFPEVPKISEEAIIKMAEKLNTFVSKNAE
jgi:hypothetical protein